MIEITRATQEAEKIQNILAEAISLAEAMARSMARMDPDELFAAASRRNQLNALCTEHTAELGKHLQEIARGQGWKELTIASLLALAPGPAAILQAALIEVNIRANTLRMYDAVNKARGTRALAFLRSALSGQAVSSSAYDRRGAAAANPPLSTSSRTA